MSFNSTYRRFTGAQTKKFIELTIPSGTITHENVQQCFEQSCKLLNIKRNHNHGSILKSSCGIKCEDDRTRAMKEKLRRKLAMRKQKK